MADRVYIVYNDDEVDGLTLGPQEWRRTNGLFFGEQTVYPRFSNDGGPAATMSFRFNGTAFALYGNDGAANITVTVDSNPPRTVNTGNFSPGETTHRVWYYGSARSGISPGDHSVSITDIHGLALDFLVVTPGPDTPLTGKTLMLDDSYKDVRFTGSGWGTSKDKFKRATNNSFIPFLGSVHRTSVIGDGMVVDFLGSNMKVYGVLPESASSGRIDLEYRIDAGQPRTISHSHRVPVDRMFQLLVDTGDLDSGKHNLSITLTGRSNMDLVVDYLLYSPGFETLATIGEGSLNSTSTPEDTEGASTFATEPLPATSSALPPSPSDGSSTGVALSSGKKAPTGAIVGGVLGGIIIILLLVMLVLFRRRRIAKQNTNMEEARAVGWVPPVAASQTPRSLDQNTEAASTTVVASQDPFSTPRISGKRAQYATSAPSPDPFTAAFGGNTSEAGATSLSASPPPTSPITGRGDGDESEGPPAYSYQR